MSKNSFVIKPDDDWWNYKEAYKKMNNLRKKEFTAPNGIKRTFWFRDGTNDESTIIACFEQDYYQILDEEFKNRDVVIDLGAHLGAVSLLFSTIKPKLKIIAVEPLPENCELLRKNIEENKLNIKVYERLLWSRSNRKMPIYYGDNSLSGKVHKFNGQMNLTDSEVFASKRKSVEVKTISLKTIFKEQKIKGCRLMKVDIEGAELEVFNKVSKNILGKIKKIVGEFHDVDFKKPEKLKKVNVEWRK